MIYLNVGSRVGFYLAVLDANFPKFACLPSNANFAKTISVIVYLKWIQNCRLNLLRLNFLGSAEKALSLSVRKKSIEIDC